MSAIKVEIKNGKAYITSPYNVDFIRRIKLSGGKWSTVSNRWYVPEPALPAVRAMMMEVYGETDEGPASEYVTLIVKWLKNDWEPCGPVTLAGRVIASAWSRDSGAKVGDNVAFIVGSPTSGGSRNNWTTEIKEGSVVEIYYMPLNKAEELVKSHPSYIEVSIKGTPVVDKDALRVEREQLVKRIAEIDALLANE